jgi:hypothetical protein
MGVLNELIGSVSCVLPALLFCFVFVFADCELDPAGEIRQVLRVGATCTTEAASKQLSSLLVCCTLSTHGQIHTARSFIPIILPSNCTSKRIDLALKRAEKGE